MEFTDPENPLCKPHKVHAEDIFQRLLQWLGKLSPNRGIWLARKTQCVVDREGIIFNIYLVKKQCDYSWNMFCKWEISSSEWPLGFHNLPSCPSTAPPPATFHNGRMFSWALGSLPFPASLTAMYGLASKLYQWNVSRDVWNSKSYLWDEWVHPLPLFLHSTKWISDVTMRVGTAVLGHMFKAGYH